MFHVLIMIIISPVHKETIIVTPIGQAKRPQNELLSVLVVAVPSFYNDY